MYVTNKNNLKKKKKKKSGANRVQTTRQERDPEKKRDTQARIKTRMTPAINRIKLDLRSLHTEPEIFAHWKINTISRCVNHVYTLPPKFSSVIKNLDWVRFFPFFASVASILRCFDSSEPPYKRTPKSRMAKFIHFVSQHKALYIDPCTLSSQKLVVVFLICGSSIASKASNLATDILK